VLGKVWSCRRMAWIGLTQAIQCHRSYDSRAAILASISALRSAALPRRYPGGSWPNISRRASESASLRTKKFTQASVYTYCRKAAL
jgi:hypothetical protein